MSVDINWETLTQGDDGAALADTIRAFVHDRFQQLHLPHLIRSVRCHAFEFGNATPHIVLKDICDPLPDFYESEEEEEDSSPIADDHAVTKPNANVQHPGRVDEVKRSSKDETSSKRLRELRASRDESVSSAVSASTASAFLRGTANLGYFHLPLSAGLSGTTTPLAAVAGAHFPANGGPSRDPPEHIGHHHSDSFSSISPPSSATPPSRPQSQDYSFLNRHGSLAPEDVPDLAPLAADTQYDPGPNDLQVVFHATYAGDVKLRLTADVFLDYPMPSFVGIPLKLNITGLKFDGVGILAYIKKKAHLSFLSPEDAEALIGADNIDLPQKMPENASQADNPDAQTKFGGLIEEIKIESEIGETDNGRQVLKNVGKIEKFILEKVQQIFEDEFVYPSFWTFLV